MERTQRKVTAIPQALRALSDGLSLTPSRARTADGRGSTNWTLATALATEIGLFLWLAEAFAVPRIAAVTLGLTVAAALLVVLAGRSSGRRRPWPATVALITAGVMNAVMAAFMVMVLFLVLMQGALAGRGILPFLAVIFLLAFALLLVMTFALGVLMGTGPLPLLTVPMVLSVGVGVVLFQAISPGGGRVIRRLPGEEGRPRSISGP